MVEVEEAPTKINLLTLVEHAGEAFVICPGNIVLLSIAHETKSAGGIVLPDSKGSQDRMMYGVVIGCGLFQERTGKIRTDVADFPFPRGTIIEHRCPHPYYTTRKWGTELNIRTDEWSRAFLPGFKFDFDLEALNTDNLRWAYKLHKSSR